MTSRFGVVHAIAECRDCEWSTQSYRSARRMAAQHARRNGHLVAVEVGLNGYYDGRGETKNMERKKP